MTVGSGVRGANAPGLALGDAANVLEGFLDVSVFQVLRHLGVLTSHDGWSAGFHG